MNHYGIEGEMKALLHEWTGTGVRDIEATPLKGDSIWSLMNKRENKRYIGIQRAEWEKIKDSAKISDNEYNIGGFICDIHSAYAPRDYLIFLAGRRS